MNWFGGSLRRHARPRTSTPAQRQREHFLAAAAGRGSNAPAIHTRPEDFIPSFLAGRKLPRSVAQDREEGEADESSRAPPSSISNSSKMPHPRREGNAADGIAEEAEGPEGAKATNTDAADAATAFERARLDLLAQDDWAGLRAARPMLPPSSLRIGKPLPSHVGRPASWSAVNQKRRGQAGKGGATGGAVEKATRKRRMAVVLRKEGDEDRAAGTRGDNQKQQGITRPFKRPRVDPKPEPFDPLKGPFMSGALLLVDVDEHSGEDGITVTIGRQPIKGKAVHSQASGRHRSPAPGSIYRAGTRSPKSTMAPLHIDLTQIPTSSSSSLSTEDLPLDDFDLENIQQTQYLQESQDRHSYNQIPPSDTRIRRAQAFEDSPFNYPQSDYFSHSQNRVCQESQHSQHQIHGLNRSTTHTHDDDEPHPARRACRSRHSATPAGPMARFLHPPQPSGPAAASLPPHADLRHSSDARRTCSSGRSLTGRDDGITYENEQGFDGECEVRRSSPALGAQGDTDSCADMGRDTDAGVVARGSDMQRRPKRKQREERKQREQAGTAGGQQNGQVYLRVRRARRARQASDIPPHEKCEQYPPVSSRASAAAASTGRPAAEKIKFGRAIDAAETTCTLTESSRTISNGHTSVSGDDVLPAQRRPEPAPVQPRGGESSLTHKLKGSASSGSGENKKRKTDSGGDEDEDTAWKRFVLGASSSSSAPSMLAHASLSASPQADTAADHPTARAGSETRRSACDGVGPPGAGVRRAAAGQRRGGRRDGNGGGSRRDCDGGGASSDGTVRAASPGSGQAPRQDRPSPARSHAAPGGSGAGARSWERPTTARGGISRATSTDSNALRRTSAGRSGSKGGGRATGLSVPQGPLSRGSTSSSRSGGTGGGGGRAPAVPPGRASKALRRPKLVRLRAVARPPVPAAGSPASVRGRSKGARVGESGGRGEVGGSIFDFPVSSEDEDRGQDEE